MEAFGAAEAFGVAEAAGEAEAFGSAEAAGEAEAFGFAEAVGSIAFLVSLSVACSVFFSVSDSVSAAVSVSAASVSGIRFLQPARLNAAQAVINKKRMVFFFTLNPPLNCTVKCRGKSLFSVFYHVAF